MEEEEEEEMHAEREHRKLFASLYLSCNEAGHKRKYTVKDLYISRYIRAYGGGLVLSLLPRV